MLDTVTEVYEACYIHNLRFAFIFRGHETPPVTEVRNVKVMYIYNIK